ncbi:hypothetical protein VP01_2790g4 [Puccinia sorghi]|uniref:Uncharacterized protein n=1 Tax=Puccinia sorghi TaxID=27349 RepID=A0A0L6V2N4_9BASI|nr:hypothetical protein VP01_2790g4 [Puccinia sorghi]
MSDKDNIPMDVKKYKGLVKPHPELGVKEVEIVETMVNRAGAEQIGFFKWMKEYLVTLLGPSECSENDFQKIKWCSHHNFLEDGQLKKRSETHSQIIVSIP